MDINFKLGFDKLASKLERQRSSNKKHLAAGALASGAGYGGVALAHNIAMKRKESALDKVIRKSSVQDFLDRNTTEYHNTGKLPKRGLRGITTKHKLLGAAAGAGIVGLSHLYNKRKIDKGN